MDKVKKYARFLMIMSGLGGLLYGVDIGCISQALPYIEATASYTADQLGLVVGMVLWGSVLSAFIAGPLAEKFGRKKILILATGCFLLSIPVICGSGFFQGGNYPMLVAGRLLQGAASGLIGVVVPMYLAECLDAGNRGKGTAMFQLVLTIGLVFTALVGLVVTTIVGAAIKPADGQVLSPETYSSWIVAWQTIFWVSAIPGIVLFIGAFKLKESPRWLYMKGHEKEALESLAANNGEEKAKEILQQIKEAHEAELVQDAENKAARKSESVFKKKYILPFLLAVSVLILTQATGVNSILNYSVKIFSQCGMDGTFANWSDLIVKITNVVMTIVAFYLVDRKGRKFLLKLGTFGIIVGLAGVGAIFFMLDNNMIASNMTSGIIVTIFFFIFIAFYAIGPGVCVWLALSELMPNRIRANGMAIGMVLNQATSATIASIFPVWVEGAGMSTVFFTLAGFTVVFFLIAAFALPETKGKTLEEISKFFE
ncbi:MAG: sugar porter family MFS transporter [Coriobacteriia bacterium]|nr:sugar porter family MFS transporter [Coriobacteriia bacterium]